MAKLVDILARELEEWPESAGNICSQDSDREARFEKPRFDFYLSELADDAAKGIDHGGGVQVTRAEWRAAVDALKAAREIIGYWHPKEGNHHNKPFAVLSKRESTRTECGKGCEGEKECGKEYHVLYEYWEWKPVEKVAPAWDGVGLPPVGTVCEHQVFGCAGWTKATILAYGEKKTFYRDEYGHEWSRLSDEIKFRPIRTPEQIAAEEREKAACELYYTINWHGGVPEWKNQTTCRRADYFRAIDAGYRKQEQK